MHLSLALQKDGLDDEKLFLEVLPALMRREISAPRLAGSGMVSIEIAGTGACFTVDFLARSARRGLATSATLLRISEAVCKSWRSGQAIDMTRALRDAEIEVHGYLSDLMDLERVLRGAIG